MSQQREPNDYQHVLRAAEQAAEWLERLKTAGPQDRAAYLAWLRESSMHVREMLLATAWDRVLDDLERGRPSTASSAPTNIESPKPRKTSSLQRHSHAPLPHLWKVVGASAAALLCLGVTYLLLAGHTYRTGLGQQHTVGLPDGSIAQLNTLTTLRTKYGERERTLRLAQGQATFEVQHDVARPFLVYAGDTIIRALGTKFDVHYVQNSLVIAVIEGIVGVTTAGKQDQLRAGEALRINTATGQRTRSVIRVEEALAWQQRRLVFHDHSLQEIASEFNRYNELQMSIVDDTLAARSYSGVFDAGDPLSFVAYLAQDPGISVQRTDKTLYVRSLQLGSP
jgi:transmembrane sensor